MNSKRICIGALVSSLAGSMLLGLGLLVVTPIAPAYAEGATPYATGVGTSSCSALTTAIGGTGAQGASGENVYHANVYRAWAQGFVTALNLSEATHGEKVTDQTAMTLDAQWSWLRDFCVAHPDDLYMAAVASLAGHLKGLPAQKTAP